MSSKKKTKLKKIEFSSVDMVRRGANQEAHINLYKSEGEPPGTPVEAPESPNPGDIPQSLWKSIVEAVKSFMGQTEGSEPKSAGNTTEEVEKAADTFAERVAQQEIRDNRWKYQDALNCSIESILSDSDLTDEEKEDMMNTSIDQFSAAYKEMCAMLLKTTAYKSSNTDMPKIGKSQDPEEDTDNEEEGEEEMKIDKSRFSPEELADYERLIAKGRVEEDVDDELEKEEPAKKKEEDPVEKSAEMHPEVKKALDEMAELKKSLEMKDLTSIAKKYAPLGKKENELAETLYEMKKSSQASYDAYLAVLDQNLELVNKTGMFEEIGKSSRSVAGGSTVEKIESIATELQKSDATLGRHMAIAKAWEQHPELVAEYDNEYMGGK